MDANSPTQFDEQPSVLRSWPEVESKIEIPGAWLGVVVLTVFLAAGIALCIGLGRSSPAGFGRLVGMMLGLHFAVLAAIGLAGVVVFSVRNRAFRHASRDVLPEVPREPVLQKDQTTFSCITHHLEFTERGLRLSPKPHLFRKRIWLAYLWTTGFVVFVAMCLWWKIDFDALTKASLICITALLAYIFPGVFEAIHNKKAKERGTVDFDTQADLCRVTNGNSETCFSLSAIVALQICCVHRVFGTSNEKTILPALELNLVWENSQSPEMLAEKCQRTTVMNPGGAHPEFIRLAVNLANQLDVPLLNHATSEDWKLESKRSKTRAVEQSGDAI
ncbi:hypothetical protein [Planctomicrobium piriforme]|uniref:Uncharacterized protein n=1 Tax=Planctomicrobium piriforme TaxID=1576369 RepID=A0A1I3TCM8_9PLAN|nr:hypothetical protein [Planctomicrobium piriforme]SFJ68139.1 hypothetical protein SAMN05421753_1292 [Planctomicrobium piriforme]